MAFMEIMEQMVKPGGLTEEELDAIASQLSFTNSPEPLRAVIEQELGAPLGSYQKQELPKGAPPTFGVPVLGTQVGPTGLVEPNVAVPSTQFRSAPPQEAPLEETPPPEAPDEAKRAVDPVDMALAMQAFQPAQPRVLQPPHPGALGAARLANALVPGLYNRRRNRLPELQRYYDQITGGQ